MTFVLGSRSVANSKGMNPRLMLVVTTALGRSLVDFGIAGPAVRTAEEQNKLYQQGRTTPGDKVTDKDGYKNKSNHQMTGDGTGHSVDLTAWVNGKWDFNDWNLYYEIAWAMVQAAKELKTKIRWGGNWNEDVMLCNSLSDVKAMKSRYKGRLPDGPHFKLV